MPVTYISSLGSTYVPMDSWIYPALDRLHGMGYLDTAYLGMRPWTRLSIAHMLQETSNKIDSHPDDEAALEIFLALRKEFEADEEGGNGQRVAHMELESTYTDFRGIAGTPLRDSFNLGQTIVNDYGRPYQEGFNNYSGFSARAEAGRFSLYFRGEYQHAPGAAGYSQALAEYLSERATVPFATNPVQDTIPEGPIAEANPFRVMEASLSYHLLGHEISFGKNDHWLSPASGGAMSWSTNAENIYTFDINRVEPLRIPGLSRITGPFRYEFFVGSLKGHTAPNDPWTHMEKISFKPTKNLELGFERTVIWGGKGHEPITIHTFLKSFFSVQNVTYQEKFSRDDPGARFGSFDFNYRLPFVRNWLTLYSDSEAHDDVNPISAPRRSGIRPGLYLSHTPGLPQLDLRVEAADTMPVSDANSPGFFLYNESVQKQGTTNKGFMFSDWIGRGAKGGQAWLTYHLSPNENIQFAYRNAKVDQAFIAGGTTQNLYTISAVKRVMKDIEIRGSVQHEEWKAPIYKTGQQGDTTVEAQFTWFPKLEKKF
ncbi:capsule assembly Wzi family protein [Silvibacterium dinghuense]|uniref:Capsule assembly Wzi family protein n=2 Tax=Silvibacterium dinghuense TaxID=1560006 RepID=A0A4Q1SL99_9BACT|nr:capsule assembly Wzi family protein [Silvibacterium dinghuense]